MNSVSQRANRSIWATSGVVSVSTWASIPLIRPIWVSAAVAVTRPRPVPAAISVPENSIERPVAERGILGNRRGALVHGHRLAGQDRLLGLQPARLDQPQIGRHPVARLDQHDVARHQLGRVDALAPPVAQHGRARRQHPADRRHRLFGPAFLDVADHRVDDHHREDHAGVDPVLEQRRDHGRGEQHIDQHVVEMREKPQDRAAPRRFGQPVGAVFGQAAGSGLRAQTRGRGIKGLAAPPVPKTREIGSPCQVGSFAFFRSAARGAPTRAVYATDAKPCRSAQGGAPSNRAGLRSAHGAPPFSVLNCRARVRYHGPVALKRLPLPRPETTLPARARWHCRQTTRCGPTIRHPSAMSAPHIRPPASAPCTPVALTARRLPHAFTAGNRSRCIGRAHTLSGSRNTWHSGLFLIWVTWNRNLAYFAETTISGATGTPAR